MRANPVRLSSGTCGSRKYVAAMAVADPKKIPALTPNASRGVDLMSSQAGAELLASRLVKVWAAEGRKIEAWVIKLSVRDADDRHSKPAWIVRTDLVGGMPSGLGRAKWERKFGGEF